MSRLTRGGVRKGSRDQGIEGSGDRGIEGSRDRGIGESKEAVCKDRGISRAPAPRPCYLLCGLASWRAAVLAWRSAPVGGGLSAPSLALPRSQEALTGE